MSSTLERSTTPDWTVQVADRVESAVTGFRDKTTVPLAKAARGLVYGMIAGTLGIVAIVLVAILAVRALSYLPFHSPAPDTHGRAVWAAEAIVGGIFTLPGLFFLRRANRRKG
jgi:hypothetical protein